MIYRLGAIEIDTVNFVLTRNGRQVAVEPLVFDLIAYLVRNRDRLLTRDELLDEIWPGRVVSDTSLSNHIKSARKALGDDGQAQKIIKTIHGRGYRFVGEIEAITNPDSTDAQRLPGRRRTLGFALILVALVVVALAGRNVFFGPEEKIESVAVLPLTNLSNDPAQNYFVEGMQDALITRLSRLTELRVISKTSTLRYEGTDKPIPEIARELNVDALIEGSVLRDDNRVRITAQLVHGVDDEYLWANSYDRELTEVLVLINEISMAIAEEIQATVRQKAVADAAQLQPISLEAHELVLQGKHAFDRFRFDESLYYYQQAVQLEPRFAAAHEGMAGTYFVKAFFDGALAPDLVPKSRAAALQAISLDSGTAGAYAVLGAIGLYFDRDWEMARRNLVRALELNPNDARTRHAYADYLMVMGNLEESLRQVEIGRLYDPFSPMANSVAAFHKILTGRFDEVIDEIQKDMAERPGLENDLSNYREALWLAGRYEEAFEVYKQSWGRDAELLRAMELGYQAAGYQGAIRYLADALAERDPAFKDSVTVAKLYARANEPEKALLWLEKAHQHREPQVLHVEAMPAFQSLRADPRYHELLRKIGFPAEQ